ncbi:MAG: hypothetical protein K8J09_22940 [Planctomycetes bacterium]|nr:hypothetical protein [Planctomycetota bacterium]MCC7398947.1 hypothetical protein [Planctomycetota bacterium]
MVTAPRTLPHALCLLTTLATTSVIAQAKPTPNKPAPPPAKTVATPSVLPVPKVLGTPMRRLDGMPVTAAYNRDGSLLLATCFGNPAVVFDPRTGKTLAQLRGEGIGSTGAFCGPKHDRVVVAFQEDGVRLFDARTEKQLARLAGALSPAVSSDGLTIAVGKGKNVLLLDTMTLKVLATIAVGDEVASAKFSADGKQLVVGVLDGDRRPSQNDKLVDLTQKKVVGEQPAPPLLGRVLPLPDGKTALRHRAASLSATNVEVFELPDGPAITKCRVPLLASSFLVLKNGAELIAGDSDGRMAHVDLGSGEVKHTWAAHSTTVSRLVAAPDDKQFVSMSWDGIVKFWNVDDGQEQFLSPQHNQAVYTVDFAADGSLVSGAADGSVIRWADDGAMVQRHTHHQGAIAGAEATPAGLWSAGLDSTLRLVDANGSEVTQVPLEGKYAFPTAFCSTADGTLISGHRDGTVQWCDGRSGEEQRRGDHHTNGIQVVVCDASGANVVSGGVDGHLVFWDPATASPRAKVKAHADGVRHLCLGPDGQAYSVGDDGDLKQWHAAKGELVRSVTIGEQKPRLDAVTATAKAGLLVVASRDQLLCLQLADLSLVGTVKLPADCFVLANSADGNRIAAGLADGTVVLFDFAAPPPAAAPTTPAKNPPTKPKR